MELTNETATVELRDTDLHVTGADGSASFPIREMPDELLSWQLDSRRTLFESIAKRQPITNFQAHLPVIATVNSDGSFPIHTATKATGLVPRDEYLDLYVETLSTALRAAKDRPWKESEPQRIGAARRLYENAAHVDRRKFALIEIFQGQTYRNLMRNPRMTIQYTGAAPEYLSYQLNGVVELIGPEDPRFEFPRLMRQLFEHDSFHVQQPAYPSGYFFWISEVFDKSPRRRGDRRVR